MPKGRGISRNTQPISLDLIHQLLAFLGRVIVIWMRMRSEPIDFYTIVTGFSNELENA
jgi:hypothetical protein